MKFIKNKKLILKILAIMLIVVVIVVLIMSLSNKREPDVLGETEFKPLEFEHNLTSERLNYNFSINQTNKINPTVIDSEIKSEIPINSSGVEQATTSKTQTAERKTPLHLIIPKLNVNTPIVIGVDGEAAIHQGAWLYPSSYEEQGEKILLGHRRYWGVDDPRSFWNLDQLVAGDIIEYVNQDGIVTKYAVKSVAVRNEGDFSVLKASKEDIIKVISCSTADGSAGSSEKRIVVIAQAV